MNPLRHNLYNPYQSPRIPFNSYRPPSRIPFNSPRFDLYFPYQRPTFNQRPANNQGRQRFPSTNNNNGHGNVIWTSQWTEWLPASKVDWKALKQRTFVQKNLHSLSPKRLAGNPTRGAINRYQGLVKQYFSEILPFSGSNT